MKIKSVLFAISLLTAFFSLSSSAQAEEKIFTIGASAIVEHPSLDAVRDGAKAELQKEGFIEGKNLHFIYKTAQNKQSTIVQIINKYVGDNVDLLLSIATASAQAAHNTTQTIPIVFSGVSAPVYAGLLKNPQAPEANVTGVSDMPPVEEQVKLMKEIVPNLKTIGFLYNPSEANSIANLERLDRVAEKYGLKVIPSAAIQTAQVRNAALALVGKVDMLYTAPDNTIVAAIETAVMVANENKIPFMAADGESTRRGALISYGTNYFEIGRQTGKMIARILRGEKIHNIPMEIAKPTELSINEKTAKAIGFQFPQSVLKRVTNRYS